MNKKRQQLIAKIVVIVLAASMVGTTILWAVQLSV